MGRQYLYTDGPEDQNHHEHRSGDRGRALVAPSFWSARITGEYPYRPLATSDLTRGAWSWTKIVPKGRSSKLLVASRKRLASFWATRRRTRKERLRKPRARFKMPSAA